MRPARLFAASVTALAVVVSMATVVQAAPALDTDPPDKIRPELQADLAAGETGFWVRFADRADLSRARRIDDWVARGEAVAGALQETARTSQVAVRAVLDGQRVGYQPFWATNALFVHSGTPALARQIAARPEVEGLYAPVGYEPIEPTPGVAEQQIDTLEWGIANINADDVWDQFGVRGEGITVASIDSGVQFDHPALVNQYRGNLGDGTFDHNYNWFDPIAVCPDAPCDFEAHGTHTMGTMVGDDGGANQIGVAPGATWITTSGCCPDDEALIASGQWLLEPTDLNGANPDASMRPHIINNSWGSLIPSTDPFMEDVIEAWDASGILGIWSNGNNGELGCGSSGSPGSRTVAYSVGAYDISNTIASFSSRGPGQDGQTKPDISAPGVNIRSSVPFDEYGVIDGTSMAAPHVAGAVALLWSAAPALVGDTDATIALLDQTAVDTGDLECGGTADDNNVYGEGRLDALALLESAPIGEVGRLAGTVTDAATGDPIAGAAISITGPSDRELATGPDGSYAVVLPPGDYRVNVSAFGYGGQTAAASVAVDQTTTADFALVTADLVTVSGLVRDGSGHGWPVYAKVSVPGVPDASTHSDPFTGRYQLSLPAGATYQLAVEPRYPGYRPLNQAIEVGEADLVRDLDVLADAESCSAPGYGRGPATFTESFDSGSLPAGWSVVDNAGNGEVWRFDDPGGQGNRTGGEDGFAIADSEFYGPDGFQDTELVSPAIDLSGVADPVIRFNQEFRLFAGGEDEFGNVDLSTDGGVTWETVLHQSLTSVLGPQETAIGIPQAAGEPDVRLRFRYGNANFEFWWMVDNVTIGTCAPAGGGLVAGLVSDRNTGAALGGATVAGPADSVRSSATPEDPALPDGFYWVFSPVTGSQPFTASSGNYAEATAQVNVEADSTTRQDFSLAAGLLSVEPASLSAQVPLGSSRLRNLTITNDGTAPVRLDLHERGGDVDILGLLRDGAGAPVRRIEVDVPFAQLAGAPAAVPGVQAAPAQLPHPEPWIELPTFPKTVFDNNVAVVDGKVYSFSGLVGGAGSPAVHVFDPVAQTWTQLGNMPGRPRLQAATGVIDGLVYLVSGWGDLDTTTMVYDPATGQWSTGADAPAGRAAAGSAVLDGDLYVVGGCTSGSCQEPAGDVFRYDPAGDRWETLASYPVPAAWQSCGAIAGLLYCAGGTTSGGQATTATYRYDPVADEWERVADMPFDLWGGGHAGANGRLLVGAGITGNSTVVTNQGLVYDPATDTWDELPAAGSALFRSGSACGLYKVGGTGFSPSGGFVPDDAVELLPGFDQCEADLPWLSVNPATATLDPGERLVVTVRLDGNVAQPGTYTAALRIGEDTPYRVTSVDVTMKVTPPASWGRLTGTVTGVDCRGDQAPLPEATVHLSTRLMEHTLFTGTQGGYAYWLDRRHSPFTMIVAKDGYQPQVRQTRVAAGKVTVENWTLTRVCAGAIGGPM